MSERAPNTVTTQHVADLANNIIDGFISDAAKDGVVQTPQENANYMEHRGYMDKIADKTEDRVKEYAERYGMTEEEAIWMFDNPVAVSAIVKYIGSAFNPNRSK